MSRRAANLALIIVRLAIASIIATPFAMWSIALASQLLGDSGGLSNPFESAQVFFIFALILFAGVMTIGVPAAIFVFRKFDRTWARVSALVIAGIGVNLFLFTIFVPFIGGVFAAPAGGIVALTCCLVNLPQIAKTKPFSLE